MLPNQSLRCRAESDASPPILRSAAIIAWASRLFATQATILLPGPTIAQLKPSGPPAREGSIFQWFIDRNLISLFGHLRTKFGHKIGARNVSTKLTPLLGIWKHQSRLALALAAKGVLQHS